MKLLIAESSPTSFMIVKHLIHTVIHTLQYVSFIFTIMKYLTITCQHPSGKFHPRES